MERERERERERMIARDMERVSYKEKGDYCEWKVKKTWMKLLPHT